MKIATLQYTYPPLKNWGDFVKKNEMIVKNLSKNGIPLILFPEYAHSELFSIIKGKEFDGFQEMLLHYPEFFQTLSRKYKLYTCSKTYFVKEGNSYRTRAFFFGPTGYCGFQDKIQLTPSEHEEQRFSSGSSLQIFMTAALYNNSIASISRVVQ